MSLAKLTVDLIAESSKFRSELDKANKSAKTWSDGVRGSVDAAAKSIATMGATAATAMAAMYTLTAKNIDEQTKFADRIGITTEALAALQYAGELTGVASDRMADSLQGMVERVSEATEGTGEAAEALNNLGLSAEALNQLSPEKQFLEIAKAMEEVDNRSDQVRMAIQLFEGEGAALLNTLDAGVEGIEAMMTEAETLGIALNRIDAAKVEQANDAFYRSSQSAKGFAQSLTVELAPIVQGISTELVNAANAAGGFGEVSTEIVDKLASGFGVVGDIIRGWEAIFAGLGQLWKETVFAIVHDITYLDQTVTDLLNKLPGVNAEYNQTLQAMTREMSAELEQGRAELHNLLMEPLPSDSLDQYVHKWRELAEAQATAAANSKHFNSGVVPFVGATAGTDAGTDTSKEDREREKMQADLLRLEQSFLSESQLIELHEQQKLAQVEQWREADLISFQKYETLKQQVKTKADQDAAKLEAAQQSQQLQNSAQLFDGMAGLAETFAGEQSGIYKVMFAASKAFAIADSIMKIQQGIANAAAMPFPANIGAMATVAAQTASIVTTIQGTGMEGMAHDGIDSIPKEGTWLLDKGERVVDSRTNADLKQYLSEKNQSANSGAMGWTIIVNEAPPGTDVSVDEQNKTIEIAVAQTKNEILDDFTRGGPLRRAIR